MKTRRKTRFDYMGRKNRIIDRSQSFLGGTRWRPTFFFYIFSYALWKGITSFFNFALEGESISFIAVEVYNMHLGFYVLQPGFMEIGDL